MNVDGAVAHLRSIRSDMDEIDPAAIGVVLAELDRLQAIEKSLIVIRAETCNMRVVWVIDWVLRGRP